MERIYSCPYVDPVWASSRKTHLAVARAIYALANIHRDRLPQAIWEAPTEGERRQVEMIVEEYVAHGDFAWNLEGYSWGWDIVKVRAVRVLQKITRKYKETQIEGI